MSLSESKFMLQRPYDMPSAPAHPSPATRAALARPPASGRVSTRREGKLRKIGEREEELAQGGGKEIKVGAREELEWIRGEKFGQWESSILEILIDRRGTYVGMHAQWGMNAHSACAWCCARFCAGAGHCVGGSHKRPPAQIHPHVPADACVTRQHRQALPRRQKNHPLAW